MATRLGEGHSELKLGLRGVAPHSLLSYQILYFQWWESTGTSRRTVVLVLLQEDSMTTGPQTLGLFHFVMGTFNACSAREEGRLMELAHCAEEWGVEILEIQEHRRVHTDDRIVYRRVERCTFISASAWQNEAQAATDGIRSMLGSRARKALHRVNHHTDRILIAVCGQPSNNSHSHVLSHQCGTEEDQGGTGRGTQP